MLKKFFCLTLPCFFIFLQGCGVLIFNEDKMALKKYQIQEEQYRPCKLQNTIEGYKEFIEKYPENTFVNDAKSKIEGLEFAPYEQTDSIEGYMEFKMRYPNNRYVPKANWNIEQVEIKHYEKTDSIRGYREFLSKYPESIFAVLAKERLQELEIRQLDRELNKKQGFDLLKYRLRLRRLKKKLPETRSINLGDYTFFASIADKKGKKYFHTSLIYCYDLSRLDASSGEVSDMFFDNIISGLLLYLDSRFTKKDKINGFSFDISSSEHLFHKDRKILLEYYFPLNQVSLFAQKTINREDLLAGSMIIVPEKVAGKTKKEIPDKVYTASEEPVPVKTASVKKPVQVKDKPWLKEEKAPPEKMDGLSIMTRVSQRDRGKDYIISLSWEMISRTGRKHTMKTLEKWKDFKGRKGVINKKILKYINPPFHYGTSILTLNYKNKHRAFWYSREYGDASRIASTERLRPPAESDFCLTDYVEINIGEEKHTLLKKEDYNGCNCFVVESTPVKEGRQYGKRVSWIDQNNWTPLKTEYFDKKGNPWKTLRIEWQKKFGFWFWKKANAENVQTGYKTVISIEDVRVNVGLHERDFTRFGLEKRR